MGEGARAHAKKTLLPPYDPAVGLLTIPSSEILVECAISTRGERSGAPASGVSLVAGSLDRGFSASGLQKQF